MKKTIYMAIATLDCGGIEKAAISILNALDYSKYHVTLSYYVRRGIFIPYVPAAVKQVELTRMPDVEYELMRGRKRYWLHLLMTFRFGTLINSLLTYRRESQMDEAGRERARYIRFSAGTVFPNEKYDFAFGYANMEQIYYVAKHIKADRKIAWLHNELTCDRRKEIGLYADVFEAYDRIYAVSEKVKDDFCLVFPELSNRVEVFRNLIDSRFIQRRAGEYEVADVKGKTRLLTVGRLVHQKGSDVLPDIAMRLKSAGVDFVWSVVGGGALEQGIKSRVEKLGLSRFFEFVGETDNPYPYYKSCDIYVQPSRWEGYCITVAEARIFRRPIVATDFAGAKEQLENGEAGEIVSFGVDTITKGILRVINDTALRDRYVDRISKQRVDTMNEISVLTDYLEEMGS